MFTIIYRECLLSFRKRHELLNPLLFFVVVASLFPLATTPDPKILQIIGPGVIWVAALLANMLSLNKLFQDDHDDGSLVHFLLSPQPLSLLIFLKIIAHWLVFAVPLIIVSPMIAMMFHLHVHAIWILILTLLLGTPVLSLIGAIASALTVGLRNSGLLLALVLLPLYIPTLIFATSAVTAANNNMPVNAQMALLGALLALALCLSPIAASVALRIGATYDL